MRQCCPCGVERGEEVDLHGALEGFGGLRFDGADFDDAGVVDEDIDASKVGDGFGDETAALGGLGQIGGDEVEVGGAEVGMVGQEYLLRLFQLGAVAGGEHQLYRLAGEPGGDGQAQATGATSDEHHGAIGDGGAPEGVNGGCGEEGSAERGGCDAGGPDDGCGEENRLNGLQCESHGRIGCAFPDARKGANAVSCWLMATRRKSKGAYMISSVAEMYAIHPQTLRLYEREGLLRPSRSDGNTRLYTDEDLERLEFILNLARDLGVNIAGIAIVLQMRERMEEMNRQMQGFVDFVRTEMLTRMQQQEQKPGLVPLRRKPGVRE